MLLFYYIFCKCKIENTSAVRLFLKTCFVYFRSELGRIMNRGAFCKVCKARVCKGCREYNAKGTDWICTVCHKML